MSKIVLPLFGAVLGIAGFVLVPIYDQPFSACDSNPWLTLWGGCSHWPEFLRGALLVLPIAAFSHGRWLPPLLATFTLLVIALLGSAANILFGVDYIFHPSSEFPFGFVQGHPLFVGGAMTFLAWAVLRRKAQHAP